MNYDENKHQRVRRVVSTAIFQSMVSGIFNFDFDQNFFVFDPKKYENDAHVAHLFFKSWLNGHRWGAPPPLPHSYKQ